MPGHSLGALEGIEGEVWPGTYGDGDDHRLADGARDAHYEGSSQPRDSGWHDNLDGSLQLGGPQRVGTLAQCPWHCREGVFAHRSDQWQDQDAYHQPAGSHVIDIHHISAKDRAEKGSHEGQRKVTVYHGGDARQDLEYRLEGIARLSGGIFAQINGNTHPKRRDEERGNGRGNQGGGHQWQYAKSPCLRLPLGAGEKL